MRKVGIFTVVVSLMILFLFALFAPLTSNFSFVNIFFKETVEN